MFSSDTASILFVNAPTLTLGESGTSAGQYLESSRPKTPGSSPSRERPGEGG